LNLNNEKSSNNQTKEICYTKFFKSSTDSILVSSINFSNFIQLGFEDKLYVFEEDDYSKKIKKVKIIGPKPLNKFALKILSDDFQFMFYDNKMNLSFYFYDFKPNTNSGDYKLEVDMKHLNEYKENSFYCLDSALAKTNMENRLFAICGFKGTSNLIEFQKALQETKIQTFKYTPIEKIFYIENKKTKEKILFLSGAEGTQILKFDSKANLKFSDNISLNKACISQEKTISLTHYHLEENSFASHICENSIRVLQFDSETHTNIKNFFRFDFSQHKVILASSFIVNGMIFFNLYFNNNFFAIYHFDLKEESHNFIQDCIYKFPFNVSCFDFVVSIDCDNILFIVCTYNNRIELYNYTISTKSFMFCSFLDLVNDSKTEIIAESIKIYDKFVFISTRMGEFCMFLLNENIETGTATIHFITTVNLSEEKSVLSISDVNYSGKDNSIRVNLNNTSQAYLLHLKFPNNEIKNLKINKIKYLIKNETDFGNKNSNNLNVFSTMIIPSGLELVLYQNYDTISISYFTRSVSDTLIPDTIKSFNSNQLARRMIPFDDKNLIVLVESHDEEDKLNNMIYIYDILNNYENCINLDQNVKINSMKTFDIVFRDISDNDLNKTKYLGLCGNIIENDIPKGLMLIYECIMKEDRLFTIKHSNKFLFGENTTIYDFCQMKENLVFTSENKINTIKIEVDSNSKKVSFVGGIRQAYGNRVKIFFFNILADFNSISAQFIYNHSWRYSRKFHYDGIRTSKD